MPQPKTAVIYCRVSTSRQADDELPIVSQRERCKEKAEALGAVVVREFEDAGISGRDADGRPAFMAAISFCEENPPTFFITWSTSRFARNRIDAAAYKLRLARKGVDLVFASLDLDRDTDAGWLTEGMMEIFDELYSRQISADTRRSMLKNAQSGYFGGGRAPYGYRAVAATEDPRRRRLAPDAAEAPLVKEIFDLRMQGMGAATIAAHLRARGLRYRGADAWTKDLVLRILHSEAVVGRIVFGRRTRCGDGLQRQTDRDQQTVVQAHPAIIDGETWDRVQRLLAADAPASSGSPHSTHLFTGLMRCGKCGSSLQIETAKGRSRRYSYYRCRSAQKTGGCTAARLPAEDLDEWLADVLCDRIFNPQTMQKLLHELQEQSRQWADSSRASREVVAAQLADVRRRQANLFDVLEECGRDAPNLADMTERLRANKQRIIALEQELDRLGSEAPAAPTLTDDAIAMLADSLIAAARKREDPKRLRAFFGSFVSGIEVFEDQIRVLFDPNRLIPATITAVPSKDGWLPETDTQGTTPAGTHGVAAQLPDRIAFSGRRRKK